MCIRDRVYASLADLPVKPDIVDVFRRHDDLPGVAREAIEAGAKTCLLYTSDAAAERSSVDLGGRRIIKKKNRDSSWKSHNATKQKEQRRW